MPKVQSLIWWNQFGIFKTLILKPKKDLIKKLIRKIELFADKIVIYPAHTELSIVINPEKNGRLAGLNAQKLNIDQERYSELKKELKTDKEVAKFFAVSSRTLKR